MRWWLAVTFGWMALGGLIGTVLVGDEGLDANLPILLLVLIFVVWCVAVIAALKGRRGERATSPLVETVVPPPVELPRTFTERWGDFGSFALVFVAGLLLFVGLWLFASASTVCDSSGCVIPATAFSQPGLRPALGRGALVCGIAVALFAAFGVSVRLRRITCTAQGITVFTRSVWTGLRQRVCLWSDVTATTYTHHPQRGDASEPHGTFAVETSEGTAVQIRDRNGSFRCAYFDEFVAICNARTRHLPYIWARPPRCPPDYIQVPRDRGGR
jgi:hypothetical protein